MEEKKAWLTPDLVELDTDETEASPAGPIWDGVGSS